MILEKIGFTKNEAIIYETLLKHPDIIITKISRISKLDRRTVYDVVHRLIDDGFIYKKTINGINYYSATDSQIIIEEFAKTQKKLESYLVRTSNNREKNSDLDVDFLMGKQGIKVIINEILRWGKIHYAFGSLSETRKFAENEINHFLKELNTRKIPEKVIYRDTERIKKYKFGEYKKISHKNAPPISAVLYENTVALFIETNNINIIKIKSQKVFQSYLQYFNILWNQSK